MKILILQIEDRTDKKLNKLMKFNETMCKQYDHTLEYLSKTTCSYDVPPYWSKVFEIIDLIQERKDIDYIMWLDSDAILVNYENLKQLIKNNLSIIFFGSVDSFIWPGKFNAGAFVVKNNENAYDLMKFWGGLFDQSKWYKKNDKWKTNAKWAGEDYEQGSFTKHILSNHKYRSQMLILSARVFQNITCSYIPDGAISVHLAGILKNLPTAQKCYQMDPNQTKQHNMNKNSKTSKIVKFTFVILVLISILCVLKHYHTTKR